jgi:hypothetical protein
MRWPSEDDRRLRIHGDLVTGDVVALVVERGGFEEDAARAFVASTLGYSESTLPETLALELTATGSE